MDLQSIFYILAIFFMIFGIIITVGLLALVIFLEQKLSQTQNFVEQKVHEVSRPLEKVMHRSSSLTKRLLNTFLD